MEALRKRVIYLRDKLGLSDAALAKRAGVPYTTLRDFLVSKTNKFGKVNELAHALETTVEYLYNGSEPSKGNPLLHKNLIIELIMDAAESGVPPSQLIHENRQRAIEAIEPIINYKLQVGEEIEPESIKKIARDKLIK